MYCSSASSVRRAFPVLEGCLRSGTRGFITSKSLSSVSSVSPVRYNAQTRLNQEHYLYRHKININKQLYHCRTFSTNSPLLGESQEEKNPSEEGKKLTVFQRFKQTYKEHGKVLVAVHLATSAVWFGSFYYAASVGVDVVPLLEWLGCSDKIINPFRNSSVGNVAVAYLMYKLATPARYTVTLAGTNYAVKYLRKTGRMKPKEASESLRSLAKDSQKELKERTKQFKSQVDQRQVKVRKNIKSKVKERENRLKARQLAMQLKFKKQKEELLSGFAKRRKLVIAKMKERLDDKKVSHRRPPSRD